MKKTVRVLGILISALTLAYGVIGARAQSQPDQQAQSRSVDQEEVGATGQGGMRQGGMMCGDMMGGGMMGGHMGSPIMFRMMFALMDDGGGQISLQSSRWLMSEFSGRWIVTRMAK